MVIHKVKESDYVESEPATSVLNMARTLVLNYMPEGPRARSVVLVKDGPGAQKPSVRGIRYLDCRELEEDRSLLVAPDPLAAVAGPEEFSDLDPSYCDGEIRRPRGLSGLFVSTFAELTSERLATLREACRGCGGSEADTLLVELGNALEGAVTVCTGDSDLVAVLTASGREGLTLRLDNRSYREDRAMHDSPFGELLSEPNRARLGSSTRRRELSTRSLPSPVRRAARRRRAAAPRSGAARRLRAHPGGPRGSLVQIRGSRLPVPGRRQRLRLRGLLG
ncbi:hypothetical protein Q5P01_016584 [Channa striata]|uniref:Uncharacterized protein n=1 Tax=Channa striata TaxID=64152 RepID=A0AA88M7Z0_CHASR|nr:hypothetical protein Q5P01_016584 [Channa striata]